MQTEKKFKLQVYLYRNMYYVTIFYYVLFYFTVNQFLEKLVNGPQFSKGRLEVIIIFHNISEKIWNKSISKNIF